MSKKFLVACERSQVICMAMRDKGIDAYSCDIAEVNTQLSFFYKTPNPKHHIKEDVLTILNDGWDGAIFHPDCTFLTSSNTYIGRGCSKYTPEQAIEKRQLAIEFFLKLENCKIPKTATENPIGIMSKIHRKPDQIIQPYQFGHAESKATCLWLKNLPILKHTDYAEFKQYRCKCGYVFDSDLGKYGCANCAGKYIASPLWDNQTKSGQNNCSPGPDRWYKRAKTYQGIANAIADQWGPLL